MNRQHRVTKGKLLWSHNNVTQDLINADISKNKTSCTQFSQLGNLRNKKNKKTISEFIFNITEVKIPRSPITIFGLQNENFSNFPT